MRSFLAAVFAVLVFTATILTLVATPGFLSDQASTLQISANSSGARP
ncbi:MAG: hypothetical protein JOZ05_14320 [Acetobacteraceae bacterium]|nr:hypothetical protein [Acetobacteraceae bacterium]